MQFDRILFCIFYWQKRSFNMYKNYSACIFQKTDYIPPPSSLQFTLINDLIHRAISYSKVTDWLSQTGCISSMLFHKNALIVRQSEQHTAHIAVAYRQSLLLPVSGVTGINTVVCTISRCKIRACLVPEYIIRFRHRIIFVIFIAYIQFWNVDQFRVNTVRRPLRRRLAPFCSLAAASAKSALKRSPKRCSPISRYYLSCFWQ